MGSFIFIVIVEIVCISEASKTKQAIWLILSIVIGISILNIFAKFIGAIFDSKKQREIEYQNGIRFDETLQRLKNSGAKISYANKNTGTISIRHNDSTIQSISVYKGYNSHYKNRVR